MNEDLKIDDLYYWKKNLQRPERDVPQIKLFEKPLKIDEHYASKNQAIQIVIEREGGWET